jgi:hypothetical protein
MRTPDPTVDAEPPTIASTPTPVTPSVLPPPPPPPRPAGWGLALVLMIFGPVATTVYWFIWFFVDRGLLANQTSEAYYAYENAFPAADGWMAVTSLLGAVALWRRRPTALLWMLLGSSASIYLGLLDTLFNLENGIYRGHSGASLAVEVAINVLSFAIPVYVLVFAWRSRHQLLAGPRAAGSRDGDGDTDAA